MVGPFERISEDSGFMKIGNFSYSYKTAGFERTNVLHKVT